ncbi:hypothetical protein ACQR16_00110 [Bradyrhizobium oligotrophicum]|uniref:hypothetical protein n=1 Tax=Bradyrhizobium oligotrophicum TaxID=44255 RepID=UPI003EBB1C94
MWLPYPTGTVVSIQSYFPRTVCRLAGRWSTFESGLLAPILDAMALAKTCFGTPISPAVLVTKPISRACMKNKSLLKISKSGV